LNELYGGPKIASPPQGAQADVLELVPQALIDEDQAFVAYIRASNETIARRQIFYLNKYR
jgi:hypothetical protein